MVRAGAISVETEQSKTKRYPEDVCHSFTPVYMPIDYAFLTWKQRRASPQAFFLRKVIAVGRSLGTPLPSNDLISELTKLAVEQRWGDRSRYEQRTNERTNESTKESMNEQNIHIHFGRHHPHQCRNKVQKFDLLQQNKSCHSLSDTTQPTVAPANHSKV